MIVHEPEFLAEFQQGLADLEATLYGPPVSTPADDLRIGQGTVRGKDDDVLALVVAIGFSFASLCCIIRSGTPFGVICVFADLIIPKASVFLLSRHHFYV